MIGERIKQIREAKGMSRKQLADKIGITESAIFRYETNQREPKLSILCKISEVLEVPMSKIVCEDEGIKQKKFRTTSKIL